MSFKKFYFIFLLGFLNSKPLLSQNSRTEILTLKAEQISLPNRKFYIKKIICDFNQPKYFLIKKGLFSKQKNMILGDSIQRILMNYLKPSNKHMGGQAPILLIVKELKIREKRHFLREDGMAKFNVEFYIETDSKPLKIFQSNAFKTYSGFMDVTDQHESNVKSVINSCMIDFNNAKIDFSKYVISKVFKAKHTPY